MRISLIASLLAIGLIPHVAKLYFAVPQTIFLSYIYLYNIILLIFVILMSAILSKEAREERRTFFLASTFLAGFTLLSVLSVGVSVWISDVWELSEKSFAYFLPIYLLSSIPMLGYYIWKILIEFRYYRLEHFLPPVVALPLFVFVGYYYFSKLGVNDFSCFLLLETLICDSAVTLSLLILIAAYRKTESIIYYRWMLAVFVLRYAFGNALFSSLNGQLDVEYSVAVFTACSVLTFAAFYNFYKSEVRVLSYFELDEERRKFAELYSQVNELQEILKLINRMLRHDILNKLQIISGYIETYMVTKNEQLLEKAMKAVEEGSAYIEKIRELEKIVLTKREKLKPVNVRKIAEEVAKSFNVEISVRGQCFVLADDAISSVLENLISNAIKHGKSKKIDVILSEIEDECEVRVVDYGTGIPADIRGQIFREGFRYGEKAGSGLGLYIVKKLVERYGGRVWVEDTKPHGATFVIKLKAARTKHYGDDERTPLKSDEGIEF